SYNFLSPPICSLLPYALSSLLPYALSSHTLSPLSSVYKVAHVRSGVRRRVRARSGAGSSLLTFRLRLLRCCLFLSKSSLIYSRIWVSNLAPGSSPLERRNGSGGDSVSTGLVVTLVGGVSAPGGVVANQTPLRRASAVKGVIYGSSIATHNGLLQLRVLLFGSRRLQVWGDSRLQSLIASLARL
ncbi:hypothetical protein HID58_086618, partial [Brassica napus]